MGQPEVYDALRARAWLMVGGQFGLHHLYMDEPLEAFIYFSTAGLFLMGVLFDAFAIHSIVRRRNALLRRTGGEEGLSEPLVACSLSRFLSQFLFGYWIGFVYGLAAMLSFTKSRPTLHSILVGAAVCKGVYVVGNTRNQRRNLFFIWAAAFSTSFVCIQILEMHLLRSLLFVSLSATLLGNRGARAVPVHSRRFTYKTYLVLCAIYCAGLLVLTSGVSRRVFDRRIVVVSTKHHSRISSSIGLIVYDHFWGTQPNKTIFSYDAHVEYVALDAHNQQTNTDWLKPHSKSVQKEVSSANWWWDQFGGSSSDTESTLVDYLTVLTADYFRAKALARISKRNDGKFEAARWSATESGNNSENMVINAVIPDSDSVGSALLKTDISQEASPQVPIGFQQAADLHRPVTSPSLMPDRQRIAQTSMDTKLLPTPPALAPSSLTAAFSSAAVALTAAAAQSANPFIVAAALSMQQNLAASLGIQPNAATAQLPWNESPQALTAMLPYLQQLHAHAQQAALAQQLIAAQQAAAAAVTQQQHQQMANAVPQTPLAAPQQWLSPPPSATASIPDNASSPLLLNGDESYSSLSEISELSPQPRGDVISPFKEPSLLFTDEDLVIDSLIEERRDLSEKESIAVAVLAGMAACQR